MHESVNELISKVANELTSYQLHFVQMFYFKFFPLNKGHSSILVLLYAPFE